MIGWIWIIVALGATLYQAIKASYEYLRHCILTLSPHHPLINVDNINSVLLVTAHPDDECMFFTPTISQFNKLDIPVDLLCLSTGNHDGLGGQRRVELERSAAILGIRKVVIVDDDEDLSDGPEYEWSKEVISEKIDNYFESTERNGNVLLLTFDSKGVSGHPNHCDTHYGVLHFAHTSKNTYTVAVLQTETMLAIKYSSFFCLIMEAVTSFLLLKGNKSVVADRRMTVVSEDVWLAWKAMDKHKSQMVWFRYLYLAFSSYIHVNIVLILRPRPAN